jgi:MarR family transcriptional regulator, organic hydroperoxide resistance regulator
VLREQDVENRRQVNIRLTRAGAALMSELGQGILAEYRKVLDQLPEEEQEELVASFETIARILGKLT